MKVTENKRNETVNIEFDFNSDLAEVISELNQLDLRGLLSEHLETKNMDALCMFIEESDKISFKLAMADVGH